MLQVAIVIMLIPHVNGARKVSRASLKSTIQEDTIGERKSAEGAVDPQYQQFFDAKNDGKPRKLIEMRMRAQGLDPDVVFGGDQSAEGAVDPQYQQFFDAKNDGKPRKLIEMRMRAQGLNPDVVFGDDQKKPLGAVNAMQQEALDAQKKKREALDAQKKELQQRRADAVEEVVQLRQEAKDLNTMAKTVGDHNPERKQELMNKAWEKSKAALHKWEALDKWLTSAEAQLANLSPIDKYKDLGQPKPEAFLQPDQVPPKIPQNAAEAAQQLELIARVADNKRMQVNRKVREAVLRICSNSPGSCGLKPERLSGLKGFLALTTTFHGSDSKVNDALLCLSDEQKLIRKIKSLSEDAKRARLDIGNILHTCLMDLFGAQNWSADTCGQIKGCISVARTFSKKTIKDHPYEILLDCKISACHSIQPTFKPMETIDEK